MAIRIERILPLISLFVLLACFASCKDDDPVIFNPDPLEEEVYYENLQNLELGLAPLLVYGDLNWDLKVDETDREYLYEWTTNSGGVIPVPGACPAAADLNQDGDISQEDLDLMDEILGFGAVTRPSLSTHLELGCDYNHAFLAGPTYVLPGDSASLRLLTDTLPFSFIELWAEGPVDEIRPVEGNRGWDIFLSNEADPTDTFRIHLDVPGKGSFIYRVRIIENIHDMSEWAEPPTFEELPPDTVADCPNRGKGTEALIVDMRVSTFEPSAHRIKVALENAGVSATYLAPHFRSITREVDVGFFGSIKSCFSGNEALEKEIAAHNKAEATKLVNGIASYAKRVSQGRETSIEIIWSHGSERDTKNGFPCGAFASSFYDAGYPREKFHRIMYKAIDQKVCNHIVADYSCYSGLTPMGVDELNNTGFATCTRNLANQTAFRPAHDMTLAMGAAEPKLTATFFEADRLRDNWVMTIKATPSLDQLAMLLKRNLPFIGNSSYEDQGIHQVTANRRGY